MFANDMKYLVSKYTISSVVAHLEEVPIWLHLIIFIPHNLV